MKHGPGLTFRFLAAQVVVVVISLLVAAAVATIVGPTLFHDHMLMTGREDPSLELFHAEQAYRDANLITLAVALPTALFSTLLASLWLSRRLRTPLQGLTRAAASVAGGNYRVRVPAGNAGPEVSTLAQAFNTMANRMEHTEQVRRQMLSDLAHEMGTPLSVLAVYLDGLQDGVVDWNLSTHQIMSDQLTRLTRLIEDIDDVSRAQEDRIDLDLAEEGLDELLHVAAAAAGEAYADKGVGLHIEAGHDTARVMVDRQRFGQVMGNLLSNALRHTPTGGRVQVTVRQQGASAALIDITDTGDGIPPDQLEHIFERFYRGDTARSRDKGGAGIGLTISRALIEAHGGTLTAASPGAGHGSVFTLRLPLSSPVKEPPAMTTTHPGDDHDSHYPLAGTPGGIP
ncbi:ATP-binding protein [Corynebacterium genitalium ATCC 33030]|uniref:histidine kinase n=1 Tax=Corynebacterium genitalium ATCC 33030 TaxID=585529 RepID=D7WBP0_9CORY|nr:HAMP domain-containing sensor histidine kinase [Corynebacterium genitalium]EFK55271.1 ATPase/histidine kinase/DNA gyrase B/HSP90 domain protein [Corynebacterium genitalium ATCC 33030]MCQ4619088.1 HAMP domain-containing histidine kinase [Corynebacterium pseudogenitalium]UUA89474.1 ATP-binding protein [Corynebacterium genitalium ATCC 33030]